MITTKLGGSIHYTLQGVIMLPLGTFYKSQEQSKAWNKIGAGVVVYDFFVHYDGNSVHNAPNIMLKYLQSSISLHIPNRVRIHVTINCSL